MPKLPIVRPNKKVILKVLTTSKNVIGEEEAVWEQVANVWAEVKPLKGGALIAAQAQDVKADYTVTIRWRNDVNVLESRVAFDDEEYEAVHIAEPEGTRRQWLTMLVGRVRNAG